MQLWLVRHAIAAERGEFDGPDAERPLTDKGRRRFREFCGWLAEQGAMPQAVMSSPLLRAAQTAALLAKSAGLKKSLVTFSGVLAPGADVSAVAQFVRDQSAQFIALVGHEPDMSHCLSELIGGGSFAFGKGFVAAVEIDSTLTLGTGRLRWLVGPKFATK
jgi:phosphohistidine phosphatase